VSPISTARHSSTTRKAALGAAALLVTLVCTACGVAHADSVHAGHATVAVGDIAAAEPIDDEDREQPDDAGGGGDDAGAAEDGDASEEKDGQNNEDAGDDPQDEEENGRNENKNDDDANNDKNDDEKNDDGKKDDGEKDDEKDDDEELDVLGTDCTESQLPPHDGFQEAPRCVDTAFGEVAAEEKSPSLLITEAPDEVAVGEDFTISVSTQNLNRDRFLGAAQGGYYLESSFLDDEGIQRGHFHTACRMLESTDEAPDAAPAPEFFLATQDNGGGTEPDTVEITVSGMAQAGTVQCAVWAGDGSHRIPMMQRADQTPAFDAVRIKVE
jgi:hypothetical protein